MRKEICFNKDGYNRDISKLEDNVNGMNEIITYLIANGHNVVTKEEIKELITNYKEYHIKIRNRNLSKICDLFGVTLDMVFADFPSKYEEFIIGANNKTKYLKTLPYKISKIDSRYLNCLDIIDNEVILLDSADEYLKELNTYYTKNKKQDSVVDQLKNISKMYNTELLKKYSIMPAIFTTLSDGEVIINKNVFYEVYK